MKLPRNISGNQLAKALGKLGYKKNRQRGSHMDLITHSYGEHHVTVPQHKSIKTGTLNAILKQVAEHHGMTREELVNQLKL